MPLRGVLFDMGGTLLHYNAPGTNWEDTEKTGARGIYAQLRTNGITLPPEDHALEIAWEHTLSLWGQLDAYTAKELKLAAWIGHLLVKWGIVSPSPELVTNAMAAYMSAIQGHVAPLSGAADTLQSLQNQGLRIGLISNTLWPGLSHVYDLDRYGLTPYLECLVFSADAEAWKPHNVVFKIALDALDLSPSEAVYVGDSLYFDVWGAQQAGLRGIWIEQTHAWTPDGLEVTPDATIRELPELLAVVNDWS